MEPDGYIHIWMHTYVEVALSAVKSKSRAQYSHQLWKCSSESEGLSVSEEQEQPRQMIPLFPKPESLGALKDVSL